MASSTLQSAVEQLESVLQESAGARTSAVDDTELQKVIYTGQLHDDAGDGEQSTPARIKAFAARHSFAARKGPEAQETAEDNVSRQETPSCTATPDASQHSTLGQPDMAPPASHLEVSHVVPKDGQLVPVGKGPAAGQTRDTPLCGFLRGAGVSEQYVEATARLLELEHVDSVPCLLENLDLLQTKLPIATHSALVAYRKRIAASLPPQPIFQQPAEWLRRQEQQEQRQQQQLLPGITRAREAPRKFPTELRGPALYHTDLTDPDAVLSLSTDADEESQTIKSASRDMDPEAGPYLGEVTRPGSMAVLRKATAAVGVPSGYPPGGGGDRLVNRRRSNDFLATVLGGAMTPPPLPSHVPSLPSEPSKESLRSGGGSFGRRLSAMQSKASQESLVITQPLEMGLVWLTQIGFTLSTLVLASFYFLSPSHEKASFVTTLLTCAIAAAAYYAKATGYGDVVYQGVTVPLARYIDWIFTTPLMLYELCHLGGADFSTTLLIIGCDLITLSFGLFSAFIDRKDSSRRMLTWFFAAGFFYVMMMVALHGEVANGPALAQPQAVQDLFQSLTILTSISWSLYPVVVFLGRAECQVITKEMEEFLLVVLDIISKMGVEALIITHVVSQHGSDSTSSSSSGSA